jgi:hypothetical protein
LDVLQFRGEQKATGRLQKGAQWHEQELNDYQYISDIANNNSTQESTLDVLVVIVRETNQSFEPSEAKFSLQHHVC